MSMIWPHIYDMEDYQEYKRRVHQFLEKERIETLNPITDENGGMWLGTEFTHTPCDCCSRSLAGARIEANAYSRKRGVIVGSFYVCHDCIYFLEYGQLDDQTMLDIEKHERMKEEDEEEKLLRDMDRKMGYNP